MTLSSASDLMERLEVIRKDMAERRPRYEEAASEAKQAKRDFEYEMAMARLKETGSVQERSDKALLKVKGSGTYERMKVSEGAWEGLRAAHSSMEAEAMILMSLLKGEKQ